MSQLGGTTPLAGRFSHRNLLSLWTLQACPAPLVALGQAPTGGGGLAGMTPQPAGGEGHVLQGESRSSAREHKPKVA